MRTLNFNGKISTLEPMTVSLKMQSQLQGIVCLATVASIPPYFPGTSIQVPSAMLHTVVVDRVGLNTEGKAPFDLAEHFMLARA
jgi:uncharacterized membrane-anchored protein